MQYYRKRKSLQSLGASQDPEKLQEGASNQSWDCQFIVDIDPETGDEIWCKFTCETQMHL